MPPLKASKKKAAKKPAAKATAAPGPVPASCAAEAPGHRAGIPECACRAAIVSLTGTCGSPPRTRERRLAASTFRVARGP